jgi:RecJ-like exonuclease
MSIYRTIKVWTDCPSCGGTGRTHVLPSTGEEVDCAACGGTGKVETIRRASRAAVSRAQDAVQTLPPAERPAARAQLQTKEDAPTGRKAGKVGKGVIEENE